MSSMKAYKHFFISLESISKAGNSFPFDLYLFQPLSGAFILELPQETILTQDKLEYFQTITQRGAMLAVSLESMRSYLDHTGLKKNEIPGLNVEEHPLYKLMIQHREEYKDLLSTPFNYLEAIRNIIRTENFSELIQRTKAELCQFSFTKAPIVSLAHQLAIDYLNDQKHINKSVALCYAFARELGIDNDEELSHLVVATFYRDIGVSQISYEQFILQNPNDNLERGFQKHPALSLFLLNKSNLKLPPKTMKIIMDHHERFNGKGYPSGKKEQQLELLPQIIGLADHITAFASGQIVPNKSSYLKVFKALSKKTEITGLEHGYHPSLSELLIKIVMDFD